MVNWSIYSVNFKMEGWMWHPERYKKFKSFDVKSFKIYLDEANNISSW